MAEHDLPLQDSLAGSLETIVAIQSETTTLQYFCPLYVNAFNSLKRPTIKWQILSYEVHKHLISNQPFLGRVIAPLCYGQCKEGLITRSEACGPSFPRTILVWIPSKLHLSLVDWACALREFYLLATPNSNTHHLHKLPWVTSCTRSSQYHFHNLGPSATLDPLLKSPHPLKCGAEALQPTGPCIDARAKHCAQLKPARRESKDKCHHLKNS